MTAPASLYKFRVDDRQLPVHPERTEVAAAIDANHDRVLEDSEIRDYLVARGELGPPRDADEARVLREFKLHLQKQPNPAVRGYLSYEQLTEELHRLARRHADRATLVSLGRTTEGREIWALRIGNDIAAAPARPGIVLTGAHHAREWMSMEAPLEVARQLLEGYSTDPEMRRRVDSANLWVVPLVNPDGYEYSRTQDSWWRKNRRPIHDTGCGREDDRIPVGVDLNRNYDDGTPEHAYLYRPPGDAPCNTRDDFGWATSDNPFSSVYRGPHGASEPEVQAMLRLELDPANNVRGVIDHHGYGRMILYPWGHTDEPVENQDEYLRIGNRMAEALDVPYRVMSGSDLYPTSGSSVDIQHANGILSFTLEIGRSFQPDPDQVPVIARRVARADMAFIDEILAREAGTPDGSAVPPGYRVADRPLHLA